MLKVLQRIVQEISAATDFGEALKIMVERVRDAIETEACTIFLLNPETDELVLMATAGLNPDAVGKIRLQRNQGLVGFVAEREEPINLDNAPAHPNFLFHPEVDEAGFQAFLGVPMIHQRKLFGVIVVQEKQHRKYGEDEEAFLITLSAQLAGVIAHAHATGSIKALFQPHPYWQTAADELCLHGIAACPGIAIGQAVMIYPLADLDAVPDKKIENIPEEIKLFKDAVTKAREKLVNLSKRLAPQLKAEELALFDVYLKILDSSGIGEEVIKEIQNGQWAQGALRSVIQRHLRHFDAMEDSYLRERGADIRDLGLKVLAELQQSQPVRIEYPEHTILIGDNVPASVLAEVPEGRLAGLVSVQGSGVSHVAILARALGIPAVMGVQGLLMRQLSSETTEVIVDGYHGQVYLHPSKKLRKEYQALVQEERDLDTNLEALRGLSAVTPDGHLISLFVNAGLAADAGLSLSVGAEGVGLFRTEVPFLNRERFPTEEEQRIIYRQLLNAFSPRPVIMRTLDVGGDKSLPYFPVVEENPFLGWRGIRLTLDHPDVFLVQVRAMLKASHELNNLRIMLPMITTTTEVEEALELIDQAYREIIEEGLEIQKPPIGVMIEVPSAVYQARSLARKVDFLSIGSNDLTQYILAVDRNNSHVANIYESLHPAVLAAMQYVVEQGHAEGKKVSICGEMASDPASVIVLIGMDFDALSMSSISLPRVKWVIRNIPKTQAKEMLQMVMQMENPKVIRFHLEQMLEQYGLGGLIRAGK